MEDEKMEVQPLTKDEVSNVVTEILNKSVADIKQSFQENIVSFFNNLQKTQENEREKETKVESSELADF